MNVSATKCDFADLKFEQLLGEKYFVETCFTKKFESYNAQNRLSDMWITIKADQMQLCDKSSKEVKN